ncbi:MAG: cytochrome c biogenesis protein CcdA [Heliobacteriaceae bacterium]|nr:cytochrome c biogenesis protein CcdA [Heliobacteriaceae bacterium]
MADLFRHGGSLPILFTLSFLGGLIASISPCSLAMLPIIVGYVGGYSKDKPSKTLVQMLFFVLGTAVVFSLIGIICAVTGKVFVSFMGGYFGVFLAGIILVMGLKLTGALDFEIPVLIKEIPQGEVQDTFLYPVILGGVFALAGTPCSTPILAGIMAFASLSASIPKAIFMLFLFALGQGLILILAGFITSHMKSMSKFAQASDILLKASGALLVIASIYIFYKIFAPLVVK